MITNKDFYGRDEAYDFLKQIEIQKITENLKKQREEAIEILEALKELNYDNELNLQLIKQLEEILG